MGPAECDLTRSTVYMLLLPAELSELAFKEERGKYEYLNSGFLRKNPLMDSRREVHAEGKIKVEAQIYQYNPYKVTSGKFHLMNRLFAYGILCTYYGTHSPVSLGLCHVLQCWHMCAHYAIKMS